MNPLLLPSHFANCLRLLVIGLLIGIIRPTHAADVVYSPTVCGWYQVTIRAGKSRLIANQLENPRNTVADLFSALPRRSTVDIQVTDSTSPDYGVFLTAIRNNAGTAWSFGGDYVLPVGRAAIVANGWTTDATLIFAGTVPVGPVEHVLDPAIPWFLASLVPFDVGNPLEIGYTMHRRDVFNILDEESGVYRAYTVNSLGSAWVGGALPSFKIGEGFAFECQTQSGWTQSLAIDIMSLKVQ